jgi:hypothetical protein
MMTRADSPFTRAQSLVGTSVDDLHSSLNFYDRNIQSDIETIRYGLKICERRGEKTKATMLRRKLKKMEKQNASV